jgi:error-prone DNA polymerase
VGDALRHGVEIRPIDVSQSDWDCTMEPGKINGDWAVRMGLRYVSGLGEREWQRIEAARSQAPFSSLADFTRRTSLDERSHTRLAECGALGCFGHSRRNALWKVLGLLRSQKDSLRYPYQEASTRAAPSFAKLDSLETVLWDYESSDHSVRGHPLEPLRSELRKHRLPDARTVTAMRDGQRVSYAGLVICRQRPGTAAGVVFMTLEDETGFVNVVVWKQVFEDYQVLVKSTAFLGITGKLQVQEGVVHLIAEKLWIPRLDAEPAATRSRDFH